jgi:Putative Flp pilus-assembly TadE/G-like
MILRTQSAARRPAAIVVKTAILMPVLLAVVALALDTGLLYDRGRHSQAAADAAALAAAGDLFTTYLNSDYTDNGRDPNGVAAAHARAVAKANGYPDDGTTAKVEVFIPPQTGQFVGKPGYVEVVITYYQSRGFSSIFGTGDLRVGARALARGRWQPTNIGILVLDPTSGSALKIGGGAVARVPNSPVLVNSTSATAMYASGSGPIIQSEHFEITGGYGGGTMGQQFQGPIDVGMPPTPDPYRNLPEPDPASMPRQSLQTADVINHGAGVRTYILKPGLYRNGLSFSGKDSVIMQPGIYYMEGGFSFSGQGSLTANEVMLFNDPRGNSDSVKITGQGAVTWTPPTSGVYKGMTLFQARDTTAPISISGQGGMNIKGVLYAPDALIDVSGNGDNFIGNQVVCWQMNFQGNGTFNVPWDPGVLAPVRDLRLVE